MQPVTPHAFQLSVRNGPDQAVPPALPLSCSPSLEQPLHYYVQFYKPLPYRPDPAPMFQHSHTLDPKPTSTFLWSLGTSPCSTVSPCMPRSEVTVSFLCSDTQMKAHAQSHTYRLLPLGHLSGASPPISCEESQFSEFLVTPLSIFFHHLISRQGRNNRPCLLPRQSYRRYHPLGLFTLKRTTCSQSPASAHPHRPSHHHPPCWFSPNLLLSGHPSPRAAPLGC